MKTCSQYKHLAVETLTGKWGTAILAMVVLVAIYIAINIVATQFAQGLGVKEAGEFIGSIFQIALLPIGLGWAYITLKIARYNAPTVGDLFVGFRGYWRIMLTLLIKSIYTVLWTLLLIVPGIIKSYSYAMTEYVLIDNPDLSYDAAITASSKMMQGKKWKLFVLDLSFIGWIILCLLTFGIGFIILEPYIGAAHAHFYEDLRAGEEATVTCE